MVAQRETEKFVDELTELDYFVDYDTELDFTRKFDFSEVDNRFGLEKNATRNAFNQAMMGEFLTTKQEEMLQSLTYSLDDNSKSKDIDLLHTFQLEKDWQQLSLRTKNKEQKMQEKSKSEFYSHNKMSFASIVYG